MSKYFIMAVDSLVQTFTVLDCGERITFQYEQQGSQEEFSPVEPGDGILGYQGSVRYVFQVLSAEGAEAELFKLLEVQEGAPLLDEEVLEQLESGGNFVPLEEEAYQALCRELLERQMPGREAGGLAEGAGAREEQPESPEEMPSHREEMPVLSEIPVTAPSLPVPRNYLVFGAPGTGKSYRVREKQRQFFTEPGSFERVTVYATYTYASFVGTYKPKMEGRDIVYAFVPGPFTRMLVKALKHPEKNFLLIVEEINRANPAAVFGDVFQLLDREGGRSIYPVTASEDLRLYLAEEFVPDFAERGKEEQEWILECCREIRIPSNLYIWATMNSADQGVFPMDTAFKRRWDYDYIGISEHADKISQVCFTAPDREQGTVTVSWNRLREALNRKLSEKLRVNEDKLLGPFFLSGEVLETREEDGLVTDNEAFLQALKSKVFMYLFEDAARQRRKELFSGCGAASGYSDICREFDRQGIGIFGPDIRREVLQES